MMGTMSATSQPMAFATASRTHVGLVREINEDRVLLQPQIGLWAVADGMGGHSLGDRAAALVVSALSMVGSETLCESGIRVALESANASIFAMGQEAGVTCGSTVAGLVVSRDLAFVFWVGDSRVYRLRGSELARLTTDHSVVQELYAAGVLTEQEARSDPRGNIITRALGIGNHVVVDIAIIDVRPGDLCLICSDGLSDLVEDVDILQLVDRRQIEKTADELIRASLEEGGTDNISMVLINLNDR
jgi:serine/threonine protein phosphatase PrpC